MKKKPNWKLMSTKDKAKYRAKQAVRYTAGLAMSALMVSAYYEHTKPSTHGLKAVESESSFYGPKQAAVRPHKTKESRNNRELLKKAALPQPRQFITRAVGKQLTEAGVEYWRADIFSGNKPTRGVPL